MSDGPLPLLQELGRSRDETLRYFALDERDLARTYGPDKWSVRFILHHLADSETVLYERIRRILSEPRQVLWVFDQNAWARGLDYANVPIDLSRAVYESVRGGIIHSARLHYEPKGHWERKDNMEQLPKEVAEGIPPQSDWKDAPGELVWRFEADSEMEHLGLAPFSWQVKKLTAGVHYQPDSPHNNKQRAFYFEASTPYRSCYYVGTTAEEALGALMKGVCLLSREGAINPNFPYEI